MTALSNSSCTLLPGNKISSCHSQAWQKLITEFIFSSLFCPRHSPRHCQLLLSLSEESTPRDHLMPTFLFARDEPGKVTLEVTIRAESRAVIWLSPVTIHSSPEHAKSESTPSPGKGALSLLLVLSSSLHFTPFHGRIPLAPCLGTRLHLRGPQAKFEQAILPT